MAGKLARRRAGAAGRVLSQESQSHYAGPNQQEARQMCPGSNLLRPWAYH